MQKRERKADTIHVSTFRFGSRLVGMAASGRGVVRITFPARSERAFRREIESIFPGARIAEGGGALKEARRQVAEYLAGRRRDFTLKLDMRVTPFQKRVLEATRRIPYGETASYGEIARRIGSPRAARAVGGALNRNPLSLCIPCHRVIGSDGSLVGFGGGLTLKSFLLDLEQRGPAR